MLQLVGVREESQTMFVGLRKRTERVKELEAAETSLKQELAAATAEAAKREAALAAQVESLQGQLAEHSRYSASMHEHVTQLQQALGPSASVHEQLTQALARCQGLEADLEAARQEAAREREGRETAELRLSALHDKVADDGDAQQAKLNDMKVKLAQAAQEKVELLLRLSEAEAAASGATADPAAAAGQYPSTPRVASPADRSDGTGGGPQSPMPHGAGTPSSRGSWWSRGGGGSSSAAAATARTCNSPSSAPLPAGPPPATARAQLAELEALAATVAALKLRLFRGSKLLWSMTDVTDVNEAFRAIGDVQDQARALRKKWGLPTGGSGATGSGSKGGRSSSGAVTDLQFAVPRRQAGGAGAGGLGQRASAGGSSASLAKLSPSSSQLGTPDDTPHDGSNNGSVRPQALPAEAAASGRPVANELFDLLDFVVEALKQYNRQSALKSLMGI